MSPAKMSFAAALIVIGVLPAGQASTPVSNAPTILQGFAGESARVSCGDHVLEHGFHRTGNGDRPSSSFE